MCAWLRIAYCIIFSLISTSAAATWQQIAQFPVPGCSAYFFNESVGLVGCGNGIQNSIAFPADIRRTTDGGKSWTKCVLPGTSGRVTSIIMNDSATGYASVMYGASIWETTD